MNAEVFKEIALSIPHQPGIYKYFDEKDTIIYIGKAKDLRKRVGSYFNKTLVGYKTQELVKRIAKLEFTVVNSEQDAFFLENALIKEYRPKYNIELKDDKSYPFIVIKKEPFPRVFLTRRKINDGSEYLGPFTSVGQVRELLYLLKQHIPMRSCKLALTDKNIKANKFKLCLEYHLGNCKGPCVGLQNQKDYLESLQMMKQVLKGQLSGVVHLYKKQMQDAVSAMAFEKAEIIKKKLEHLENYQAKSVIVSHQVGDVDVFTLVLNQQSAFINYLMVRHGTIIQTHTLPLTAKLDESEAELLAFGIAQIRSSLNSEACEIVTEMPIDYTEPGIAVTVARAGDKKKLLDLSRKNASVFVAEIQRRQMLHMQEKTAETQLITLRELQEYLQLAELPNHIECFDNSNFQGEYPVSAMVCFKNGLPSKSDYRHYNVKTVIGINDFATMYEVVYRRYKRLRDENASLPQLVIIDGGKGQLNSAIEAIDALQLQGRMTLVGLAKNVEEIFMVGDRESQKLPWNSESLKLVRFIRDEVHRFGITFHRQQRSKGALKNELEEIPGIGETTAQMLLSEFKSVKKVKAAQLPAIEKIIGPAKAKMVFNYFHPLGMAE